MENERFGSCNGRFQLQNAANSKEHGRLCKSGKKNKTEKQHPKTIPDPNINNLNDAESPILWWMVGLRRFGRDCKAERSWIWVEG
jgi:hypothetical protein